MAKRMGKRRICVQKRFFICLGIALMTLTAFLLYSAGQPSAARAGVSPQTLRFVSPEPQSDSDGPREIIVDAGHGGADEGAAGVVTGRQEKEINLEIAGKLKSVLEKRGYAVVMTREKDEMIAPGKEEDMHRREEIIRTEKADAFVSIHQNFFDKGSGARGPQVFYRDRGALGYQLALDIQKELNTQLKINNPREVNSGDYQLLRPGNQPSVIVECGFLSNPEEEQKLQKDDYQQRLCQAVADGIDRYFFR